MKNYLITGGLGFVGRHMAKKILSLGHKVHIVDNLYEGSGALSLKDWPNHLKPSLLEEKNLEISKIDCRDFFKSKDSNLFKYDEVLHLAAIVGGRLVIENDPLAVGVDLSIDAEFFYWLSKLNKKPSKIHYFSSSASYPVSYQTSLEPKLLSENMIDLTGDIGYPDLTYGWSKLTGEFLAYTYNKQFGTDTICYRPFSGYGEDQDMTYPFPSILDRCVKANSDDEILVWGTGNQSRDFIYIEDAVNAVVNNSLTGFEQINLSRGIKTTFNELAREMLNILGKNNKIINTSSKPEGVFQRVGCVKKQSENNIVNEVSISQGIKKSLNLKYGFDF